jgi:cob(I)alamin adenosyltransferase
MKFWKDTGEYKIMEKLKPYYEIYQFGNEGWLCTDSSKKEICEGGLCLSVREIKDPDKEMAMKGLEFARKKSEEKPDLMILDEICLAVHMGLLDVDDVISLLCVIPAGTDVVLTGRYAPKELIEKADFVNEIVSVKAPDTIVTTKGIQF